MKGSRNTPGDGSTTSGFGNALRRLRIEQGLSMAELARRIHYSKGHVNNVEHAVKLPSELFAQACDDVLAAHGELRALVPELPRRALSALVRPAQLPPGPGPFVGRVEEFARLDGLLSTVARPSIVAIDGQPGIGKTSLALSWIRRIHDLYPDGLLFTDLRGHSPTLAPVDPAEVLEEFLRALGVAADQVPATVSERTTLYRSLLDGRRMLVMLDNAASSSQVRPLLPGTGSTAAVVTSRTRLSSLAVHDGACLLTLEAFTASDAIDLMRDVIGSERVDTQPGAAADVARHCAFLPLAVRLAAERIAARPHVTLADLAGGLAKESTRLNVLAVNDDDTAIRAVFSWSYRALRPATARMFRLLSLHAGPTISTAAAAALAGTTVADASKILNALADEHLVAEVRHERFQFHDLIRLYAIELASAEDYRTERDSAIHRQLTWLLQTAYSASQLLGPTELPHETDLPISPVLTFNTFEDSLNWFDAEIGTIVAAIHQAFALGRYDLSWQLALNLFEFYHLRQPWSLWESVYNVGLAAAQKSGNSGGEASMSHGLGMACYGLHRFVDSIYHFSRALDIRRETSDRVGQGWSLLGLAMVYTETDRTAEASQYFSRALNLHEEVNFQYGQAVTLICMARMWRHVGDIEKALTCSLRALNIFRASGNPHGEGDALHQLGEVYAAEGQTTVAQQWLQQSLQVRRSVGDSSGEADTLVALAETLRQDGDMPSARRYLNEASAIFRDRGDPLPTNLEQLLQL